MLVITRPGISGLSGAFWKRGLRGFQPSGIGGAGLGRSDGLGDLCGVYGGFMEILWALFWVISDGISMD